MPRLLVASLTVLTVAVHAPTAAAEVRSASVQLPGYALAVAYDRDAGHVTMTTTTQRNPADVVNQVTLAQSCPPAPGGTTPTGFLEVRTMFTGGSARASVAGDPSDIVGTYSESADGLTIAGDVTGAALARHDWRCATGSVGPSSARRDFTIWFAGYEPARPADPMPVVVPQPTPEPEPQPEPQRLTPRSAAAFVRAELERRWPEEVANGREVYVLCPKQQIKRSSRARCAFEIALAGDERRAGSMIVTRDGAVQRVQQGIVRTTLRPCPASLTPDKRFGRGLAVTERRVSTSQARCRGAAQMARFFDSHFTSAWPGPSARRRLKITALRADRGFEPLLEYRCDVIARQTKYRWLYRVECVTDRGARIRYVARVGTP